MKAMPTRRDVKIHFPKEVIDSWHSNGRVTTHFFNTLSTLFPRGERFFIDSLRYYKQDINNEELKKAITAFIGQEAMHSREHIQYNRALDEKGYPAEKIHQRLTKALDFAQDNLPKKLQLSATLALEHYTAMLANLLLENEEFRGEKSNPELLEAWMWHAYEETEHKAVSYDVWKEVSKGGLGDYALRTGGFVIASSIFWPALMYAHYKMVQADKSLSALDKIKGYKDLARVLFASKKGPDFKHMIKEIADYFKPNFHPWDHDNSKLLHSIDEKVREIALRHQELKKAA